MIVEHHSNRTTKDKPNKRYFKCFKSDAEESPPGRYYEEHETANCVGSCDDLWPVTCDSPKLATRTQPPGLAWFGHVAWSKLTSGERPCPRQYRWKTGAKPKFCSNSIRSSCFVFCCWWCPFATLAAACQILWAPLA